MDTTVDECIDHTLECLTGFSREESTKILKEVATIKHIEL